MRFTEVQPCGLVTEFTQPCGCGITAPSHTERMFEKFFGNETRLSSYRQQLVDLDAENIDDFGTPLPGYRSFREEIVRKIEWLESEIAYKAVIEAEKEEV